MKKRQALVLTLLSLALILLGLLVRRRLWVRFDLTKNRTYTISPVSRNLYAEIPDQVRITYFVSARLASSYPVPGEIEDLLREYAAYSRGKIRVNVRDPAKADMLEAVENIGIRGRQIDIVERDEAGIATVYSGILIEYLEKAEVIPWVFALDTLEYDLSSRIRSMIRERDRRVGIMLGDSRRRWDQDFAYVDQALRRSGFSLRPLGPGDEIPDALPVLFVIGGAEELDERALYRIDRYIRRGGMVLFALDGVHVDVQGNLAARTLRDGGLLAMLASYGAAVRGELVLDQAAHTLQYQTGTAAGVTQIRMIRYPHWIGILEENGNPEHPVSARFGGIDLFWPSPIDLSPPPGVEGTPLFTTTAEAWIMKDNFITNPDESRFFAGDAEESRGKQIMGVSLSGIFPSWFGGRPMPVREGSSEELPVMPVEASPSRLIVIGDTDFASSFMQYTGGGGNIDFIIQALDWLGNDEDIIEIRNRRSFGGRLNRITDPVKKLRAMAFTEILNVGLIPFSVIAAGFVITRRRRRSGDV
jgi:ABC-type uncharacterized transport system involved in gliding motility auxiliary subunit